MLDVRYLLQNPIIDPISNQNTSNRDHGIFTGPVETESPDMTNKSTDVLAKSCRSSLAPGSGGRDNKETTISPSKDDFSMEKTLDRVSVFYFCSK